MGSEKKVDYGGGREMPPRWHQGNRARGTPKSFAQYAYKYADVMLAERNK